MPNLIPAADLSAYGKIRVSGIDAVTVLHNVLTQDIKKLNPGQHSPAALLTHTGKILFYSEVFRFQDHLIIVIENQAAAPAIALLDKYIITEEVSLEDVTQAYSFFQTFASKSEKLLCPKEQAASFTKEHAVQILPAEACEALRIRLGIPRYGIDMDENTILSETGLDKIAVSGTKGCYPGQEVVARIETYKGLTKKLCGFSLEGNAVPIAGDKIYMSSRHCEEQSDKAISSRQNQIASPAARNDSSIGWITSAASGKALGYLTKGWFDSPQRVRITEKTGKTIAGESAELFF